jgi:hypothetical protein
MSERGTLERLHLIREDPEMRSGKIWAKPGVSFSPCFIKRVGDLRGGDGGE